MAEPLNELFPWLLAVGAAAWGGWCFTRVRALEAELAALRVRLDANAEAARRAIEDREASLGRVRRQAEDERRFAHEPLVKALIPALDDFERALAYGGEQEDPILSGVRMVRSQVLHALERHGVTVVSPTEDFDPQLHEAIEVQASAAHRPGSIVLTRARGYLLHERVLRPARVVVAAQAAPEPEDPPESG